MAPHPSRYKRPDQPVMEGFAPPPPEPIQMTNKEKQEQWREERQKRADAVYYARREFVDAALEEGVRSTKEIKAELLKGIYVEGYGMVDDYGAHASNQVLADRLNAWRLRTHNKSYRAVPLVGDERDVRCPTCSAGARGKRCQSAPGRSVAKGMSHTARYALYAAHQQELAERQRASDPHAVALREYGLKLQDRVEWAVVVDDEPEEVFLGTIIDIQPPCIFEVRLDEPPGVIVQMAPEHVTIYGRAS